MVLPSKSIVLSYLSFDMGYINEQQLEELKEKISELSNKINALKNSQYQRAEQSNKQQSSIKNNN